MIVDFSNLSKTALANDFEHFIPVSKVVVGHVNVAALVIIVASVVGTTNYSLPLFRSWTHKVNFREIEYLLLLISR